ncbi:MAG TPA: hypothetical protein VN493_31280 [Thermoanaerobaculia bacterium]|nr:hypothetical protein [Thermoanaerobaculia bacterium]
MDVRLRLFTRNPPDQPVEPLVRNPSPKVDPGESAEEDGKSRLARSIRQEHRNDGQFSTDELAQAGSHLPILPRPQAVPADEDRRRLGGLDDLFQGLLPVSAGNKVVLVHPDAEMPFAESPRDIAYRRLVLTVVAQEEIVIGSHGMAMSLPVNEELLLLGAPASFSRLAAWVSSDPHPTSGP